MIPIVADALGRPEAFAEIIVSLLLVATVFALPMLLRLRLSPAARACSGLLALVVPLSWMIIALYSRSSASLIGFLGEFISVTASPVVFVAMAIWLAITILALWLLRWPHTR
jgi:hypothetical protein